MFQNSLSSKTSTIGTKDCLKKPWWTEENASSFGLHSWKWTYPMEKNIHCHNYLWKGYVSFQGIWDFILPRINPRISEKTNSKATMLPLRGSYLFPPEPIFVGRFWVSFVIGWEIFLPKKISETSPPLIKNNLPGIKFQCGKSLMCSLLDLSNGHEGRLSFAYQNGSRSWASMRCQWGLHDACMSAKDMKGSVFPLWAAAAGCMSQELWPCFRSREGTQWWPYQLGLCSSRRSFVFISTLSSMCVDAASSWIWIKRVLRNPDESHVDRRQRRVLHTVGE